MPYSWHQRGMQGNWITVSSMYVTFGSLLSLLNLCVHTLFHVSVRSHFDVHTIYLHMQHYYLQHHILFDASIIQVKGPVEKGDNRF